jgi:hypothetical protein
MVPYGTISKIKYFRFLHFKKKCKKNPKDLVYLSGFSTTKGKYI